MTANLFQIQPDRLNRTATVGTGAAALWAKAPSVASVTTAYNPGETLARHINALLQQERPLQEIIIVDNASTDGTSSLLAVHYPQVTVLHIPENLGTGGALAAGLFYAAGGKRHDLIWMFDQDSVPAPPALDLILQAAQGLSGDASAVGIFASLPVDRNLEVSATPWFWRNKFVKPPAELFDEPIMYADLTITSGSMIRRDVVEAIGFPRSDFFIDFVDYEYCLRARSCGYKIAVVTGAKLYHEIGRAQKARFFLGRQHRWSEQHPFREYYYSRNLAYCVWWLYPNLPAKAFLLLHLFRRAVGLLLFGPERLPSLKKMVQGFYDGCRARLGIRFRPEN